MAHSVNFAEKKRRDSMAKVFVIDVALCSGCYSCQVACKDEHCSNDWTPYAKPQPDTGQFWMKVDEKTNGTIPKVKVTYTPRLCNHCTKPACLAVCECGAIFKRKDGLVIINPKKCKGCGNCELTCSKAFYKEENREKSAIRVTACDNGGFNIAICDQCGDCMWMCSEKALKKAANGVILLNKKSCVGCLICVGECLRDFFFYCDDLPVPIKCSACGLCVKTCPEGVLSIESELENGGI